MLGAGLLAKRAVEMGLKVAPYIKTSLRYWQEQGLSHNTTDFYLFSPGSGVVTYYLEESGVIPYLEALGFGVVGYCIIIDQLYTPIYNDKYLILEHYRYGCMTCIGNSGPLPESVVGAVDQGDLVCAGVLSGNR